MARAMRREVEWGVGLAFIVGMLILLILAVNTFRGPTTTVMLVLAGVCFLVGVFFLSGTQESPTESTTDTARAAPPRGPAGPRGAHVGDVAPGGDAGRGCPHCGGTLVAGATTCPHCGTLL